MHAHRQQGKFQFCKFHRECNFGSRPSFRNTWSQTQRLMRHEQTSLNMDRNTTLKRKTTWANYPQFLLQLITNAKLPETLQLHQQIRNNITNIPREMYHKILNPQTYWEGNSPGGRYQRGGTRRLGSPTPLKPLAGRSTVCPVTWFKRPPSTNRTPLEGTRGLKVGLQKTETSYYTEHQVIYCGVVFSMRRIKLWM